MTKPNFTILPHAGGLLLISYRTPVAFFKNGELLRTSQKWPQTTTPHVSKFIAHCRFPVVRDVPQIEIDRIARG